MILMQPHFRPHLLLPCVQKHPCHLARFSPNSNSLRLNPIESWMVV